MIDSKPDSKAEIIFDLSKPREDMNVESYITDGIISRFDYFEKALNHAITSNLKANSDESPLLISEKSYVPQSSRHK